jgi:hypothetical protein
MARRISIAAVLTIISLVGVGVWAQRPALPPELLTSEQTPNPGFQRLTPTGWRGQIGGGTWRAASVAIDDQGTTRFQDFLVTVNGLEIHADTATLPKTGSPWALTGATLTVTKPNTPPAGR